MRLKRLVNFWIVLFVGAGLLLAPLAGPVLGAPAMAADSQMQGHMQAMSHMQGMSDDMPCCPDQTKSKNCDGCPFVALCMLTVSLPAPSGLASLIERQPVRKALLPTDDLLVDGLGAKPPDHPPRTNV
jgi:hypothetical protein